jgi:hypothetical protein
MMYYEEQIFALMTEPRAKDIISWRKDQYLTWRTIAAAAAVTWDHDAFWRETDNADQIIGMLLCQQAAKKLNVPIP